MPISTVEAVDLLRFADVISERIGSAQAELGKKRGLEREKEWLNAAAQLLDEARAAGKGLVEKARHLPELSDLREEFAGSLLNNYVDALEKLVAGITFHVSGRSPVIEALFPHQKFPPLRKAERDVVAKYQRDFEKRAKSSYVGRMLGSEDFAFALPVLEHLRATYAEYEACFGSSGLPEEEAAPLREALIQAGEKVELAVRQAKLIAEAALVPVEGAFDQSGIGLKLKKRAGRAAESKPALDGGPGAEEQVPTAEDPADAGEPEVEAAAAPAAEPEPAPATAPEAVEAAPVAVGAPATEAKPPRKKKAKAEQAEGQG